MIKLNKEIVFLINNKEKQQEKRDENNRKNTKKYYRNWLFSNKKAQKNIEFFISYKKQPKKQHKN